MSIGAATWSSVKEKELCSLREETKTIKQTMMTLLQGENQKEEENSKLKEKTDQLERNFLKKANEFDKLTFEMQECREKFKVNERLTDIQPPEGSNDNTSLGSDRYRPIKLAEEWSSLYTDEWSEAFDELFKIKKTNDNFRIEKELSDIIHASLI
ncbi:unnamed protein product [Mytilus edulis]|uniref:Uncharacterized protein n=1 Tax=Mytilus edulis TaxID=6550 RepID=A0A8S3UN07_MYTED|nr:unnamed protein product [Mytilus edulis]